MTTEQIETIKECLEHEYAVGGVAGMGELLAEANGIGREYAALINQLSRCSNAIIAGLDDSGYFSPSTGAYNQYNIKIGQIETAQVYDARLGFVLPYMVQAWIKNEPLRLHFIQNGPMYYWNWQQRQDAVYRVAAAQIKISNRIKRYIKQCFARRKSDWIISLQINYALGEIVIPKSE
jgi:hypothetical protein